MMLNPMLLGAIVMVCLTISLYMLRSWRSTRDRFFLFFAASFAISAAARLFLGLLPHASEHEPLIYLLRLGSMLVVVFAILDKNFRSKAKANGN